MAWPPQASPEDCQFWGIWDELLVKASIHLNGDQVCVPPELLNRTLAKPPHMHQGWKKCSPRPDWQFTGLAKMLSVFDYIKRSPVCTKHKASPPANPTLPQDIPKGLWQEIAANYFNHKGKEYLLIYNMFSKYPFLYKVTSKPALSLSQKLQELITKYGPPAESTQTIALPLLLKILSSSYSVSTLTTPSPAPAFPNSNGFIEQQVKMPKTTFSTSQDARTFLEDLLDLWSTPTGPNDVLVKGNSV